MPNQQINLDDHAQRFLEEQLQAGHYASADEAIAAGLELLEREQDDYEEKRAWLQNAAQEAIDEIERGEYVVVKNDKELTDLMDQISREVSARNTPRAA